MATADPTAGIREFSVQLDSFLAKEMVKPVMEQEEAVEWRNRQCVEVTLHANDKKTLSIKDIEEMHHQQNAGVVRTTIPSQDILAHHAALPLSMTSEDGIKMNSTQCSSPEKKV